MLLEFVCTGDELLSGQVVDTNSPWTEERLLRELGVMVSRVVLVPDDEDAIVEVLRAASERADVVVVSGGLGPTSDDLTADAAARAQGCAVVADPGVVAQLEARFGPGRSANQLRQARVPEGAEVILNPVGSAPLFIQRMGRAELFYLPGVPREYRKLIEVGVLPRLRSRVEREPSRRHRAVRLLKAMGLPEAELDARVAPLRAAHPEVIFGFRAVSPEVQLKLLAEGDTQAEADAALAVVDAEARALLGADLYGIDDDDFAGGVLSTLRASGHTVAVAESCTGGLVSALLSAPAGASEVLRAGAVVYTEAAKTNVAGVPPDLIETHGVVSSEVAVSLAEGIRARWSTSHGLSITGWAGPSGGTERDPVGTVYIAVAGPGGTQVVRKSFVGDRERVRNLAAAHVVDLLRRSL